MQNAVQAWFARLPMQAKAVIMLVVGAPIAAMMIFDLSIEDLFGYLPFVGIGLVVAGIGAFVGRRYLDAKKIEEQAAMNADLANKGQCCLVLPPRGESGVAWKKVHTQAVIFMDFVATMLAQFPEQHVSLEIVGSESGTVLQLWAPQQVYQTVVQGLMSAFPESQLRPPERVLKQPDALAGLSPQTAWVTLGLSQKASLPLKQVDEHSVDSLGYILAALSRRPGMGRFGIQMVVRSGQAVDEKWNNKARQDAAQVRQVMMQQRAAARAAGDRTRLAALEAKADSLNGVGAVIRVFAEPASASGLNRLAAAVVNLSRSQWNSLTQIESGQGADPVIGRHFDLKTGRKTILNADEAAPLWHVPRGETGDLIQASGADIPPSPDIVVDRKPPFHPDHRVLGFGTMRDGSQVFVVWPRGKGDFGWNTHAGFIGATGSGKSTLMANIVRQMMLSGFGAVVQEPHRSLTLDILKAVPWERESTTIWVNPTGRTRSFGLNPLDYGGDERLRMAIGDAFVAALEKIIGGDWEAAVRMRRILANSVQAIMEGIDQPTMLHMMAFLRRPEYRETVIEKVRNPEVQAFWREEFANTAGSKQQDMLGPLFTRLSPLLTKPMTRRVVGQTRTTLPLRAMMNAGMTILIDLSAKNPEVGDANASALGTLLVTSVWSAVSSRVKGSYPIPCTLMIDEFHLFVSRDIEKMYAEARGFGLGIIVATQYWSQLPPWMQDAVQNNAWTVMVGRVNDPAAAARVAKMYPGITPEQVLTLGSYTWITKVSVDQQQTAPCTVQTLPPLDPDKLRQVFLQMNGGRLPMPADQGAVPFDFFAGVPLMDAEDLRTWTAFREDMGTGELDEQAQYLAELDVSDFEHYCRLQRQADRDGYERILSDRKLVPEIELTREEEDSLGQNVVARVKRIRALSSLAAETPHVITLAQDLRLRQQMESVSSVFDELLL